MADLQKMKSTLKVTGEREVLEEDMRDYFQKFGVIEEIIVPESTNENMQKKEVHVVFKSEDIINELVKSPEKIIKGKKVVVSKSTYLSDTVPKPPGTIVEEIMIEGMSVQSFIDKYGSSKS